VVPAPGDPSVVVTFTGNNSTATFDDWNTRVCEGGSNEDDICNPDVQCPGGTCNVGTLLCEGGSNDGNACDPNVQCSGGTCTGRVCAAGIFDPTGATQDPGWWEGFELVGTNSSCAIVRVQFCCSAIPSDTGPQPIRPQWGAVYQGCPCQAVVGNVGVEEPVGEGRDTDGFARGLPFCPGDDNIWQTYRLPAPGVYFSPIYSAPQGTSAAPIVGGPGADYQVSVIVSACPPAACCGRVCVGGGNAGSLCNDAGDCPSGACGPDYGCDVLNEFDCDDVDGFWMGGENLPEGVEDPVVSCDNPTCVDTPPVDGQKHCVGGALQGAPCTIDANCGPAACELGVCCRGPGNCQDTATGAGTCDPTNPTNCVDRELCEDTFSPPGTFVGGPTPRDLDPPGSGAEDASGCEWVPPNSPCPICPIFEDGNCQEPDSIWYFSMDRAHPGVASDGGGVTVRIADDFIPVSNQVTQFCFQFLTGYAPPGQGITDCDDGGFTEPALDTDTWEVRFYSNDGGFPGTELPNSPGAIAPAAVAKQSNDPDDNAYIVSFVFDPPIAVDPSQKYWVEWSGVGNANLAGQATCRLWFQTSLSEGNNIAYTETDPNSAWTVEDHSGTDNDFGFCLNTGLNLDALVEPTGGCCVCDGTCTDGTTVGECMGVFQLFNDGTSPFIAPTYDGQWYPDQDCGIDFTCPNLGAGSACPGAAPPPGEACATAQVITDGIHIVSNRCSSTDGPTSYGASGCDTTNPDGTGPWAFAQDVWFEYTATCNGIVNIDLCGDSYSSDVIGAVYVNEADPQVLPACYPPATDLIPHGAGKCIESECSKQPNSTFTRFSETGMGDKYLIRVGSQDYTGTAGINDGVVYMDVFCETACFQSAPPSSEQITITGAGGGTFDNRKLRYHGIVAGDAGRQQAIRVTLNNLPAPHNVHNGRQLYVGEPRLFCENSGVRLAPSPNSPPNFGCPSPGNGPVASWYAGLQQTPFYYDWNGTCQAGTCVEGLKPGSSCTIDTDCRAAVNVVSQGFIPSTLTVTAQIDFQVVDETCDELDDANYSNIHRINVPRWGDAVSNNATNPPGPPNNVIDINDTLAILNTFKNVVPRPTKSRADVIPLCPDQVIAIGDVTAVLDAGFASDPAKRAFLGTTPPASFPFAACPN
jgi:hypothetical protein